MRQAISPCSELLLNRQFLAAVLDKRVDDDGGDYNDAAEDGPFLWLFADKDKDPDGI